MSMVGQINTVTSMNLRNVPKRLGSSMVIVIGIAGVVAVLISVLAMAVGFTQTLNNTGRPDRAIILRGGANSELTSALGRETVRVIEDAPGVKHDGQNRPIASADAVLSVPMQRKGGVRANVTLRGVTAQGAELRPEIQVVTGRAFVPGRREIIVGQAVALQFEGLQIGQHVKLRDSEWTVVGTFSSHEDSHESEILADADTLLGAYRRNFVQSVTVQLQSPGSFEQLHDALSNNPRLSVDILREPDYYASQSEKLGKILTGVGYTVGIVMAIGALFGALNTMYSAVSTRRLEIATLRAIGYGSASVVISVIVEALLLAMVGGAIGATLAWTAFNGNTVSTMGGSLTQVVFHLMVTQQLVILGVSWALLIGLIGGIFPASRAARLPVAAALRAL